MISLLFDHLWQSSLFVGVAGLLTLTLRRNSANARFWLWFTASVKFLVPFAILSALSSYFLIPITPPLSAHTLMLVEPMAQPFAGGTPLLSIPDPSVVAATTHVNLAFVLLIIWAVGFAVISIRWIVRWSQLRLLLQNAQDTQLLTPVAVKYSTSRLEPGLVGIFRPVILLPAGIDQKLSPAEMNAIVAHELCHWRRQDNLLAAIHMLVEALFWFFPLVWWLGARLNAERERACDEVVLAAGNDPKTYAEGILKVCRIYLQSPLACAAGVSGAGLKKRMEMIMENRLTHRLNVVRRLLMCTFAATTLVVPLALGLLVSPTAQVQAQVGPVPSPELNAERRAEQSLPRKEVPFNPAHFDKYIGYYRLGPYAIFTVSRDGEHFLARLTGQTNVEFFPESETKFFSSQVPAQISFSSDAQGRVTELVLHQNGLEQPAPRIAEAAAKRIEAALVERIRMDKPSPGTEAALKHQIESMISGRRDYGALTPTFASVIKEREQLILASLSSLGPLKSIQFHSVNQAGMDIYDVTFERGSTEWTIAPLTMDGKITGMSWRVLP